MTKRFIVICTTILLIVSILGGCGSSSKESTAASDYGNQSVAPAAAAGNDVKATFSQVTSAEMDDSYQSGTVKGKTQNTGSAEAPKDASAFVNEYSLAGTGSTISSVSNAILDERKIIRSANLTIEVDNFDEALNNINSIILGIGIVQQSNISTDRVYVDNVLKLVRNGTIVLRVSKDKFETVINNLKGIGDVYNQAINGQDVTDQFVDTESRLRLLKLEQSKLEAHLLKIEDLDQIFKIESRLTEIRRQIENLTGNLNKMSSLVELSTITISMNEKYPGSEKRTQPLTYWEKLTRKLKTRLEGVATFLGEFVIFIISAIPVLLVMGLFVLLGLFIYRRIPKRHRETVTVIKKNGSEEKKEE